MVPKTDQTAATPAHDSQDMTVDGCVCPQCYKPLKAPAITDGGADRYGRKLRSYAGMCFECRRGCRVVQFELDGKWLLHAYLPHRYEAGRFVGVGDWIEVNPLPDPPAVVTGPGGDFDKALNLSADLVLPLLRSAAGMMSKVANTIGELLKAIEQLQNTDRQKQNAKHQKPNND